MPIKSFVFVSPSDNSCKEHQWNEVLAITNDIFLHNDRKIYEKQPCYNVSSLWRTDFATLLALSLYQGCTVLDRSLEGF